MEYGALAVGWSIDPAGLFFIGLCRRIDDPGNGCARKSNFSGAGPAD